MTQATARPIRSTSRRLIEAILDRAGVVIDGDRPWDIRVHDERFFDRALAQGSLGVGESYMAGLWDCAQLDEMVARCRRVDFARELSFDWPTKLIGLRNRLLNPQTIRRAGQVAEVHYDLSNEFFARMLGPSMAYSCAYWRNARTLDEAQDHKHELICRKLGLTSSDRVLDIGCGWGGFARYAATRVGCTVVGITVSRQQYEYARVACAGLPIDVRLCDYRAPELKGLGRFSRVVSIGMFEHVGQRNYATYFDVARRLLRDDGLFLLHTIGVPTGDGFDPWLERYIFPNYMLPSPTALARALESRFIVEDWHNFGADYDRTLLAWNANFEQAQNTADVPGHATFRRMWRFYLLSCAGTFRARTSAQVWQLVLSKSGVPGGYCSVR